MIELAALNAELASLAPRELIVRLLAENSGPACITCSFQAEDMIVLDLLRQVRPRIPVLFLDTGYHFAATYAYRDRMAARWNLNLQNIAAKQSVAAQESQFGILNRTDPGRCCHLRKVEPLAESLAPFDFWFTGLRREQSPTRKNLQLVEHHALPSGKTLLKISPLAAWDWARVWEHTRFHIHRISPALRRRLSQHRLRALHSDSRAGRGSAFRALGRRKLECGIHTFSKKEA